MTAVSQKQELCLNKKVQIMLKITTNELCLYYEDNMFQSKYIQLLSIQEHNKCQTKALIVNELVMRYQLDAWCFE